MTEIRYYPLIDCDTEGTEKVAMIPTLNQNTVMAQSKMWLEEMIPSYFRLCIRPGVSTNGITIHCPCCGKILSAINETKQGLYVCRHCANK